MIHILNTNIYIGTEQDFFQNFGNQKVAIVNVAGNLHSKILGYKPKGGDPSYILHKADKVLSVNFVDSEDPKYYNWQNSGTSVFKQILDFIDNHKDSKVLVSCNQGFSRSPSIVMLYLAKRIKSIDNKSFDSAVQQFTQIYPSYAPGLGIKLFLTKNWENIK